MDRAEVRKLLALLQNIFPAYRAYKDADTAAAWIISLEPYRYEDAKAAALDEARTVGKPPNAGDILRRLPPPAPVTQQTCEYDKYLPDALLMLSRFERHKLLHRLAGLPTWAEARKAGEKFPAWFARMQSTEPFASIMQVTTQAECDRIENAFFRQHGITDPPPMWE